MHVNMYWLQGLKQLLDSLMSNQAAFHFLEPVDVNAVPEYLNEIKKPMDFGTIK